MVKKSKTPNMNLHMDLARAEVEAKTKHLPAKQRARWKRNMLKRRKDAIERNYPLIRDMVRMEYLEGRRRADIADELGVSSDKIKRLHDRYPWLVQQCLEEIRDEIHSKHLHTLARVQCRLSELSEKGVDKLAQLLGDEDVPVSLQHKIAKDLIEMSGASMRKGAGRPAHDEVPLDARVISAVTSTMDVFDESDVIDVTPEEESN